MLMLGVSARETPASAWRAQRAQGIISDGQSRGLALGVGTSEARSAALVPRENNNSEVGSATPTAMAVGKARGPEPEPPKCLAGMV